MMAPPASWFTRVFIAKHLFRALFACLFSALAFAGASNAHAKSISNTAFAQWQVDNESFSIQSNEVSFTIVQPKAVLHTYTPLPGANETVPLLPTYCGTANSAKLTQQDLQSTPTPIIETGQLHVGQMLVVGVFAPQANLDPASIETITVDLATLDGDHETIVAYESSPNSGTFYASIPTTPKPPPVLQNDCKLSLSAGEKITVSAHPNGSTEELANGEVDALADPFGMVFDSFDGRPVDGAKVTLIDQATNAPAKVFAFDGVTPFPATVFSGQPIADAAGNTFQPNAGEYLFPLTALGSYRIKVEPPSPYVAPSVATPEQISLLHRPDGSSFRISPASYGANFVLDSLAPLETDVPVDALGASITITKSVSRAEARAGDALYYKVTLRNADAKLSTRPVSLTDEASNWLRLRLDSVRIDGEETDGGFAADPDGHGYSLDLESLAPGETRVVSYVMTVRPDAQPGEALNRVNALTEDGLSASAQAVVRIERDQLFDRMTLIGRVTAGDCNDADNAPGIRGVRIMLEDGSFAITDETGRYHFEGLVPGTHVVEAAPSTLPEGGRFLKCAGSTRSAGSATSRFLVGQGGSLLRANFAAFVPKEISSSAKSTSPSAESDQDAAGANTNWFEFGDGPAEFLYPAADHNPRSPAVRVAIRHGIKQSVKLLVDGKEVDALTFDGAQKSPDKRYAVSLWRGIRLKGNETHLSAIILDASGHELERLERSVQFADTPMRAELVKERSNLSADGVSRPVLAVRFLDRRSRPVHSGISGTFKLDGPYQAASALDARKSQALTGLGSASATWHVEGDDGIALIELAPTMVSGALDIKFQFSDGEIAREETLQAWIEPGDQPWTLIGLAEGSVGAHTIADHMERTGNFNSDLGDDARIALYAKGRVLGKYLVTLSYDSAKQKANQRLLGVIDPSAYYTVFGDASERLFDAASREKLYVRVESAAFYAIYGDFETGFDETDLGRYQRTITGLKAEGRYKGINVNAFAAKVGTSHQRDEIQGNGLTGPYALSSRDILANSEIVAIEVRDRLRPEILVDRRELTRFVDYDIDLLSGTITFSAPVTSRDANLNPQFIVMDYETAGSGKENWNGGIRASWTNDAGSLHIGGTFITDKDDASRTNLYASDVRLRLGTTTEIRAEAALSTNDGETSKALSLEVEHRTENLDVLAYAQQIDSHFGVRQQNLSERGHRKIGSDLRVALNDHWSIVASGWYDQSLDDESERKALEVRTTWRDDRTDAFVGLSYLNDVLSTGERRSSTVAEAGVSRRIFDNRLEISGATSVALGKAEAIDLPARHRFSLRYSLTSDIKLVGTYEIANGEELDSRSLQGGLEISAWKGSRIVSTIGTQSLGSDAQRTFAGFGLGQTLQLTEKLTLDATIDGNRTIDGGIELDQVYDPDHPVSSGGFLSPDGGLGEDFTAFSVGANWRNDRWNARIRGEYRDGEWADRQGIAFAAIRQLGEGSAVGGGLTWTKATGEAGTSSEIMDAALSFAHRPSDSTFAVLAKLEYRSDNVTGAVAGETGPAGRAAFTISGDGKSERLIASISSNWTPLRGPDAQRVEIGLFAGVRQSLDNYEGFDLSGTSVFAGLDARIGIGDKVDIGGRSTIRANVSEGSYSFALGPEISFSPADNMLLSVGYNITGFRDHDFSTARSTDKGFFASFRIKFDTLTLEGLGVGGRSRQ